jgi:protein-S-isoprenylcysteine O-methyltransferase Ste14
MMKASTALLLGFIITSMMLLLPAGTLTYHRAWLFIVLLFTPIFIVGAALLVKNPKLLRKRLEMKEPEKGQKNVVALSSLFLASSFIIAGLDYRFGWSHISTTVVLIASVTLLAGYALYAEVLRENTYLSRVVEIQEGQRVIDTGLYSIVRHPMYLAVTLIYLAIPLILGSWWALLVISPCILLLIVRIKNEEQLLRQELFGYTDYMKRVRYRMIPLVW